jgi:Zn-dependent peptidase ImmA (M78 family)/transcriptional regulator with XRE-family HTH domain
MQVKAYATPSVLNWARRMAGLTVEEAARKANVNPTRIKEWEEGLRHPSIIQLRKLSDIYKRTLGVFFLNKPPQDDALPRDFRRSEPLKNLTPTPNLRLAIREAHTRRETAIALFDELGEKPSLFTVKASPTEDPEAVGERIRGVILSGSSPPEGDTRLDFNFWRLATENAGVLVFQAGDIDPGEMRGFSIADRPLPAVVLNIKDSYSGRLFSLMHEIAHIAIRRAGLCLLEDQGPNSETQQIEKFCNHVAGAILMPASSLLRQPEVPPTRASQISDAALRLLSRRYGTSQEAVLRRLVILNRIEAVYYGRKRQDFLKEYKQSEQNAGAAGFAPPSTLAVAHRGKLFSRLVLEAYDEERITSSDVAAYLGVRVKHLEKIRAALEYQPTTDENA